MILAWMQNHWFLQKLQLGVDAAKTALEKKAPDFPKYNYKRLRKEEDLEEGCALEASDTVWLNLNFEMNKYEESQ